MEKIKELAWRQKELENELNVTTIDMKELENAIKNNPDRGNIYNPILSDYKTRQTILRHELLKINKEINKMKEEMKKEEDSLSVFEKAKQKLLSQNKPYDKIEDTCEEKVTDPVYGDGLLDKVVINGKLHTENYAFENVNIQIEYDENENVVSVSEDKYRNTDVCKTTLYELKDHESHVIRLGHHFEEDQSALAEGEETKTANDLMKEFPHACDCANCNECEPKVKVKNIDVDLTGIDNFQELANQISKEINRIRQEKFPNTPTRVEFNNEVKSGLFENGPAFTSGIHIIPIGIK